MLAVGVLADDGDARGTRPVCRPCLDWSERRPHLAGILGAAICAHALDQGWVRRRAGTWALPTTPKSQVKIPNLAKLFVAHLFEIGVAARPPLTPAQAERAELLSNFEIYLLRQRGLSQRTIYHVLRFAHRFLDHRFGDNMLDLPALTVRDVVAFMEHLLARKRPFRDKTPATHLRSFFQYLFAQGLTITNLSLSVPRMQKPWGVRIPRFLSPDEVEAVLSSVRINPRRGARD